MEISNSPMEIHRNWLDLPQDVTLIIMKKLDVFEILKSTQFVCKMWFILCKEPSLWRTLRIRGLKKPQMNFCLFKDKGEMKDEENAPTKMYFSVVDRSNGGLIEFDIEGFCPQDLFEYTIFWSSQLKRLRLARCNNGFIIAKTLKGLIEMLPCLEELELTLCDILTSDIISIILSCSALTTFKLNKQGSLNPYSASDDEAMAIATRMPKLRHLQLIGNNITNFGLIVILDRCPLLQSLDLRACFQLDLAGNYLGKGLLENIKDLRRPDDSTEDYKYKNHVVVYYDDYDDIPYVDTVSDLDYGYDIPCHNDFYFFFDW